MFFVNNNRGTCLSLKVSYFIAFIMLLLTGAVYRGVASYLDVVVKTPVMLPVPLSQFPIAASSWKGVDVPLSESIQRIAGNDDFINRLYTNDENSMWCSVYITYSARPRYMSGHKPQICYVAVGWIHESTDESEIVLLDGRLIKFLVHRFRKPSPQKNEIVVLNFYILNGIVTLDDSAFTGLSWRSPNISGDHARYVAQIQISSEFEKNAQSWLEQMAGLIFDFLPDADGIVQAETTIKVSQN